MRTLAYILIAMIAAGLSLVIYTSWSNHQHARQVKSLGLKEVDNGDVQFWLMQGAPNNRYIPCTVHYYFDQSLDEAIVLSRLKELVAPYQMFKRNIVNVDGLPYWQSAEPDWQTNFHRLAADEDMVSLRVAADADLSQAQQPGEGVPLFRAYLSADGRQLTFMWHHVISDFEGMFNKHARHLFLLDVERTRFGYQIGNQQSETAPATATTSRSISFENALTDRPLGFETTAFDVTRHVLPISDEALYDLGRTAGLPMSDIFSFLTMRAVTRYHESTDIDEREKLRPIVTPLSLRTSSLATDEGNNRAIKQFPLTFPLENTDEMYQRIMTLAPSSSSYEQAGKAMKVARRYSFLEAPLRRLGSPDYISNYFPFADMPVYLGDARVTSHELRVPMVPHERTKFAWSNYAGEVQLFLHTDPKLINAKLMAQSFEQATSDVLDFLREVQ